MLPDPPNKIGYFTTKPKNKAFIEWKGMGKYHERITKYNIFMERQEKRRRQLKYKKDLDILMKIKKDRNFDMLNRRRPQDID